jgi:pseudouridine synthase
MSNDGERINKLIALNLGLARREVDNLIANGRVYVDGKLAVLGQRVGDDAVITVDGEQLGDAPSFTYLMLNKPTNYVCSRRGQGDTPTIYELLPEKYHSLKLVGRLDKNSSGLIILTNDGDFSHQMTHPSFHKVKIYKVRLDHDLEPLHQQMISDRGIQLDDGTSRLSLERLSDRDRREWQVTMSEGRNRQIRRTFDALGYAVIKLHRTQFGPYGLDAVEEGKYIEMSVTPRT